MADSKYGKYIITEPKPNRESSLTRRDDAPGPDMGKWVMYMDEEYPQGAFYTECGWLLKAYPDKIWAKTHTHDWDEVITFFGSNMEDVKDLGGEVELWLEDEYFLLTKSCAVFVPKGMKHRLIIKRVDRPIFHFTTGPTGKYVHDMLEN